MPDPRLLKTFLTVAAGLSFRQAAADLHYAPSSISTHIKALEEELGVPLFERTGQSVILTEQGRRLLGPAKRLTELAEQTRRIVVEGDGAPTELTVRLSETLGLHCLPRALPAFRARFPDVRLRLITQSRHGLIRDLRHGLTDLAFIMGEPFRAAGVTVTCVHREPLVVIAPPASPLAGRSGVGPEDLAGVCLLLTPQVWSARRDIEAALFAAGVSPAGLIECSSMEIVKRCVMAGQGLSILPRFAGAREAARGELAVMAWDRGELVAPVLLAVAADRELCAPALGFIEEIKGVFPSPGQPEA